MHDLKFSIWVKFAECVVNLHDNQMLIVSDVNGSTLLERQAHPAISDILEIYNETVDKNGQHVYCISVKDIDMLNLYLDMVSL